MLLIELIEVLSSILRNISISGAARVCSIMLQAATLFRRCCSFKKMTKQNTQDEISTYIFLKIRTILESISIALVSAGEKTLKMPSGDEKTVDLYWIFSHLLQNIMPNLVPNDIIHQVTPLALERSLSFLNFDLISPLAPSPECLIEKYTAEVDSKIVKSADRLRSLDRSIRDCVKFCEDGENLPKSEFLKLAQSSLASLGQGTKKLAIFF